MKRLQQDAADRLAEFKQAERARWARVQGAVMTGTWSPPELTEQERMEREQQIDAGTIPF